MIQLYKLYNFKKQLAHREDIKINDYFLISLKLQEIDRLQCEKNIWL